VPPKARVHPRLPADQRRLSLIETAIDLFSQKGFSGTTTKEIAAAAGVTEAIVFRHFATKRDLYTAILEHRLNGVDIDAWMALARQFMDCNDDEGLFRFLISQIIEQSRKEPKFERLVLFAALEGQELAVMHHQIAQPILKPLTDYIEKRQREGAIRKGDSKALLMAIAGVAKFYGAQKYIYQTCPAQSSDEEVTELFLALFLNGIREQQATGGSK
jgi:TetR/AcrR family transcriptional regulator